MKKVDPTVKKETLYIAVSTLLMSALMQAVFLIIGKWNYTVILGNLLGFTGSVLNFFLMGLTVQNALDKEEKEAKNAVRISQHLRLIMVLVFASLGAALPIFNIWTALLPFLFPRIAIMLRPLFSKNDEGM